MDKIFELCFTFCSLVTSKPNEPDHPSIHEISKVGELQLLNLEGIWASEFILVHCFIWNQKQSTIFNSTGKFLAINELQYPITNFVIKDIRRVSCAKWNFNSSQFGKEPFIGQCNSWWEKSVSIKRWEGKAEKLFYKRKDQILRFPFENWRFSLMEISGTTLIGIYTPNFSGKETQQKELLRSTIENDPTFNLEDFYFLDRYQR